MKTIQIVVLLAVALLVQTTGGGAPIDLVLIVVVLAALQRGPIVGLWTGTFAGLLQDGLSGGIIGVSGLTKTITGFIAGVVGSRFILGTIWHRLAVLMAASFMHAFCYLGVYTLIGSEGPAVPISVVAVQATVNGVVGVVAPLVIGAAPGMTDRFRRGRNPLSRRRWIMS